jgi:two-component system, cell cycle response regulator
MNILVADDDPTSRLIVATALRSLGHECQTVTDGVQAWDAFRSQRPDVVISDWVMPGLTGLQLCRNIRAHDPGRYVYFIMVSGQGLLDEILEGMTAGADDYLVKPLNPDDLQARLIAAARVTSLHGQLAQQRTELEALNLDLISIARGDPLTGLGNRRALKEDLELLEARVARYGHRYCMGLLDVDHFKSYNDAYGHQAGDEVLQAVAAQLKANARSGDALYRYGGEEFLCILPEQSMASGTQAIERMRSGVERLAVPHAGSPAGVLTVSAGVAMLDPDHARSASAVIKEADVALYRAKQLGRNRVERVEQPATSAPLAHAEIVVDVAHGRLIAPAAG